MGVAWPTDSETSTTEKPDCYTHVFQGRGRARLYKATQESIESVRQQRNWKENRGRNLCYSFHETEWMRWSKEV